MIPAAFDYIRAGSLAEAIDLLQQDAEGTKLVAGGHTLITTLKLRLASPALLVDIRGIADLKGLSIDHETIRIGALTTHAELLGSEPLHDILPVVRQAANRIADPQVRNRETIGGSLANADPAADWPAVVIALNAELEDYGTQRRATRRRKRLLRRHFFDGTRAERSARGDPRPAACIGSAIHLPEDTPSSERLCGRGRRGRCARGSRRGCGGVNRRHRRRQSCFFR